MMPANIRIVCEGNVMHRVIYYVPGQYGIVECLPEGPSVPAPPELVTPHPDSKRARSELMGFPVLRFYGNVTVETGP